MILKMVMQGVFDGVGIAVRACSAVIAGALIVRAVFSKSPRLASRPSLQPVFEYTEPFIVHIRRILPYHLANRDMDYSPLVSAIIILFLGLGVSAFCDIAAGILLGR